MNIVLGFLSNAIEINPTSEIGIFSDFSIVINYDDKSGYVKSFSEWGFQNALKEYAEIEDEIIKGRNSNAVLVSSKSIESLRLDYPSYYADTTLFLNALRAALDGSEIIV